jgi:hypothetical protein
VFGPIPVMAAGDPDEDRLEALWGDLEKGETEATLAVLRLSAHPKDATDFLAKKLKPLKLSSVQLKTLMLKLGNGNEAVWKPALEELEHLDPRLVLDLPELMSRYTDAPGRQRMVELMSGRPAGSLKTQELSLMKVEGGYNFVVKTERGNASFWAKHCVDRLGSPTWDYPKTTFSESGDDHHSDRLNVPISALGNALAIVTVVTALFSTPNDTNQSSGYRTTSRARNRSPDQ